MDWAKKIFQEPSTLLALMSSGLVGLVVGFANGMIQRRHGGWPSFFSSLTTGVSMAVIVGLAVQDYIHSETLRLAVVGACAVISDDIWAGLKTFGGGLRTDPLGAISRLIDALRGKSVATVEAPNPTPTEEK